MKKKFAAVAFDSEHETFIVHVASFSLILLNTDISLFCKPYIAGLIAEEYSIKISIKYSDFANVFLSELPFYLFEHTGINNHAIKLVNGQQSSYWPIYSLEPVELETLKAYIETNLPNRFIRPSKSPGKASILFNQKLDKSFGLYVNYWGFNNLTIKNQYLLLLIGKLLNRLRKVRRLTHLDFTSADYQIRICEGDK